MSILNAVRAHLALGTVEPQGDSWSIIVKALERGDVELGNIGAFRGVSACYEDAAEEGNEEISFYAEATPDYRKHYDNEHLLLGSIYVDPKAHRQYASGKLSVLLYDWHDLHDYGAYQSVSIPRGGTPVKSALKKMVEEIIKYIKVGHNVYGTVEPGARPLFDIKSMAQLRRLKHGNQVPDIMGLINAGIENDEDSIRIPGTHVRYVLDAYDKPSSEGVLGGLDIYGSRGPDDRHAYHGRLCRYQGHWDLDTNEDGFFSVSKIDELLRGYPEDLSVLVQVMLHHSASKNAVATVEPSGNPISDFYDYLTREFKPGPFGMRPGFPTKHWGFLHIDAHDRNSREDLHLIGKYGGHVFLDTHGLTLGQDEEDEEDDDGGNVRLTTKHAFNPGQVQQHAKGNSVTERFDNLLTAALTKVRWI